MNCQEFWKRLAHPPGAEVSLRSEHDAHLAECPACAARMARQRELAAGLRRMAENMSGVHAPARVETRLLRAFRQQNAIAAPRERNRWLLPLCWAAAAALLLAAAIFLTGGRQPERHPQMALLTEPSSAPDADAAADAVPEGFIPLPNAERIGPNDDVNLVRMEVPRSTMVELGLAVSADRGSDRVEADVLLGSDGLARAVRFLD